MRPSILVMLLTTSFMSSRRGCMNWRRLKASNCRVRAAARSAAWLICWAERAEAPERAAAGQQQRGMAVDDGEDVVEIVGDAAGELADGFHFLGLAQLLFQAFLRQGRLLAFGNIAHVQQGGGPAGIIDPADPHLDRHRPAVARPALGLELPGLALDQGLELALDAVARFGRDQGGHVHAEQLFPRESRGAGRQRD